MTRYSDGVADPVEMYARLDQAALMLDPRSRAALERWERTNVDTGQASTSDWPGWATIIPGWREWKGTE